MHKVNLVTLGCPKNTVDSERMHRMLELNGYVLSDIPEEADLIIVNTCGFIQPAKEESIAAALEAADHKQSGRCKGLIVTGCLAERYTEDLKRELAEADLVLGLAAEKDIVSHCDRLLGVKREGVVRDDRTRHLLTPRPWGYLRISDGCDRKCAFCAIPGIKGPSRSESIERLVAEAVRMVAGGVKEIALVAQDTMRYGTDIYGRIRLTDLIRELIGIEGLKWLRLLYTYPSGWKDDLIDLLAAEEKLCAYVDMPIQHASDPILKAMNRGTTKAAIGKLIRNLRARVPNLTIRSSVIVGFPGEEEDHFQELADFVDEFHFSRLAGFLYSHEEGTAAGMMIDTVSDSEKRERLDRLMSFQAVISAEINRQYIGQTLDVLVEDISDDPDFDYIGRARMDAPEIDGQVFISGRAEIGEFAEVRITDSLDYDLIGRAVDEAPLLHISQSNVSSASTRSIT